MKNLVFFIALILSCNIIVAQNYYIKFDGIEGESKSTTHRGWSDIESFSQELEKKVAVVGVTTRRGVTNLGKSISIIKKIDKSSPKLMEALTRGERIPMVELEVTDSNNVIYRFELRNVSVTNYMVMGAEMDIPKEEITISFDQQRVRYTEFDETGRQMGSIEMEYN